MSIPIDPTIALAFGLATSKGMYALLLGSGVSRSAGIPTGWEIVEDLTKKIAVLEGAPAPSDPAAWYQERFGGPPLYDQLLARIAPTAPERRQLLRGYFEPSPEELERKLKVPTVAHHAIAQLVARGYVRVILTTNFDRLLELAFQEAGVTPTVLSTPESILGALPLHHEQVVILKVHGDYLDTRIKNTTEELERYDPATDALLDRIFDEYGLIVCGWSADWDAALRSAIERCRNHRFTTSWTARGTLTTDAERLVKLRRATMIPIATADAFFADLLDKLESLEQLGRPHPLSAPIAVETLKRYIEPQPIKLHDLVMHEVEALYGRVTAGLLKPQDTDTPGDFARRLAGTEAASEIVMALLAVGAYWGGEESSQLWVKAIERLANPPEADRYDGRWPSLRRYPAVLGLYAAGLGALAVGNRSLLGMLFFLPRVRTPSEETRAVQVLNNGGGDDDILPQRAARQIPGLEKRKTPFSDHLFKVMREPLRDLTPDDAQYERLFDRFEYLLALAYVGLRLKEHPGASIWGPPGRFAWKAEGHGFTLFKDVEAEARIPHFHGWLLDDGRFESNFEKFLAAKRAFDQMASQFAWT